MNEVVWSDTALTQVEAIATYLEQFNTRAAAGVTAVLIDAGNTNRANHSRTGLPPASWRPMPPHTTFKSVAVENVDTGRRQHEVQAQAMSRRFQQLV